MDDYDCHGWLYGTKGRKKGRPNDLGYRIGYEICRSYYDKAVNKQEAIRDILNIKDFKGTKRHKVYKKTAPTRWLFAQRKTKRM